MVLVVCCFCTPQRLNCVWQAVVSVASCREVRTQDSEHAVCVRGRLSRRRSWVRLRRRLRASASVRLCVLACVCACVRACLRACACVRACVRLRRLAKSFPDSHGDMAASGRLLEGAERQAELLWERSRLDEQMVASFKTQAGARGEHTPQRVFSRVGITLYTEELERGARRPGMGAVPDACIEFAGLRQLSQLGCRA
eukprot:3850726-Pleurochrysis_carterae.AAC.1